MAKWQTRPPTLEEVSQHSWWWACTLGVTVPLVLQLDVVDNKIIDLTNTAIDGLQELNPDDWGTHWARCEFPEE
jgi:hypothetical protein